MTNSEIPDQKQQPEPPAHAPDHWVRQFSGTALSIVVPPYIRFLQGQIALRKALSFLLAARQEARAGNPHLREVYESLESSTESRQAEITYETFFAATSLISLVSEVEHFLGSAVAAALRLYPEKMGSQTFRLSDILNAGSTDELVDRAANAALHDLMYAKPLDYLAGLCEILSIKKDTLAGHWTRFVEIKARRDLGVHNNWVVNAIYERKVKEARTAVNVKTGTRLIPDFVYLQEAMDTCDRLVNAVTNALGEKWIPVATAKGSGEREQAPPPPSREGGAA